MVPALSTLRAALALARKELVVSRHLQNLRVVREPRATGALGTSGVVSASLGRAILASNLSLAPPE